MALLEDGAEIESPGEEVLVAAEYLRGLGLIEWRQRTYVKCVEPRDRDFPARNRHCRGRVFLEDGRDEDGDEIRCPVCERAVRPHALKKIRHRVLRTTLLRSGAVAWVRSRLEQVSESVTDLDERTFRVDGFAPMPIVVFVVDADGADSTYNASRVGAGSLVCYVAIGPRVPEGRFLQDSWVCRVSLVDLLVGEKDLGRVVTELAQSPRPAGQTAADFPVYAAGHVMVQPEQKPRAPGRVFVVELCEDVVRVNGAVVINPQAGPRLVLFKLLWQEFVEDLQGGVPPEDFHAQSIEKLRPLMAGKGHRYTDETSLRKLVNNLQSDLEVAVKRKLGIPIGREDIVQTCPMQSQSDTSGGYRLNPFCVAVRPAQGTGGADLS